MTIPVNWLNIEYKSAIEKISTNKIKIKQNEYLSQGNFPIIDQGKNYIGGYTNDNEKIINYNSPIIVFGDHTKVVKLINFKFAPGADGVKIVKPLNFFIPKTFYYFTKYLAKKIPDKGYSRHFQYMEKEKIPLPPINEQNRIVEKIEELFSELDKTTDDLKKTCEQLKIYRQAVLEVAFGSILEKNIFEIKTIEEIIIEKQIGIVRSNKEQNSTSTGVPYIKMNNINTLGNVDINDVVYVKVNDEELDKYKLKKNDLLINTRNSFELVGKSGIVKNDNVDRVFNNNILRLRFKNSIIPKFVNYQMLSNEIRQQIHKEKKATTNVCALYQRDILPLKLKIPKLTIQNDIVNYVEYKLSVCDSLIETVKQSLKKIEYLRQSILKKAFEGKLVPQNPEDEPAKILLERIKQEKEKFELNKKKRK